MARYQIAKVGVLDHDNADAHILPNRAGWPEYMAWLAAGNTPEPMPVVVPVISPAEQAARDELAARDTIRETLRLDGAIQALRMRTPAQIDNWVESNVVDLPSARVVLKILARVLALLARERIGT